MMIANDELEISFILVAMGMADIFLNNGFDYSYYFYYDNMPMDVPGTGLSLKVMQSQYNMSITIDNLVAYRNQGVDGANIYINVTNSISYIMLTNINSSYSASYHSAVVIMIDSATKLSLFRLRDSMFQCSFHTLVIQLF